MSWLDMHWSKLIWVLIGMLIMAIPMFLSWRSKRERKMMKRRKKQANHVARRMYLSDGVHLTKAGSDAYAANIIQHIGEEDDSETPT